MSEFSHQEAIDQLVRESVAAANAGDAEALAGVQQLRRGRIVEAELAQGVLRASLDEVIQMNLPEQPGSRSELLLMINASMCADYLKKENVDRAYPKYADRVSRDEFDYMVYDLSSATESAIKDALWLGQSVVGFAARMGQRDLSAIAQHSTGMLEISRCDTTGLHRVRDRLGSPIDPAHLVMEPIDDGLLAVAYGSEALEVIEENRSPLGGCPARNLPDTFSKPGEDIPGAKLIESYWRDFTKFVLAGV